MYVIRFYTTLAVLPNGQAILTYHLIIFICSYSIAKLEWSLIQFIC
jgi:hypothetical protein